MAQTAVRVYNINYALNAADGTAAVVQYYRYAQNQYRGDVIIPTRIEREGKKYKVTAIDNDAFKNCTKLTSIQLPQTVRKIGNSAFENCLNLRDVTYPDSLKAIGYKAFKGDTTFVHVVMPNTVETLGSNAFQGCKHIETVKLSDGLSSIQIGVFDGCISLKEITVPDKVKTIAAHAFANCIALEKATVGKSLEEVDRAFMFCPSIKEIYCNAEKMPKSIHDTRFGDDSLKKAVLYVPSALWQEYINSLFWVNFGEITKM